MPGTALVIGLALPAPALAQEAPERDAGSVRTTVRAAGTTLQTFTAQGGELRCAAVAGAVSACVPIQLRDPALLVGHRVRRGTLGPLVVGGLAGAGAASVRIRYGSRSRTVKPRRFSGFLVVLPRGVRQRQVAVTARTRGGDTTTIDFRGGKPRWAPVAGSDVLDLRVPDPVDRRTLGLLTWRTKRGASCTHLGDVVGGRVGARRGAWFTEHPIADGGDCYDLAKARDPLVHTVTTEDTTGAVTGFATPEVAAVEARVGDEPPRRLKLSPRRAFAHVFRAPATVRLTAILRDGRRVDRTIAVAPAPPPPIVAPYASRP